MENKFEKIWDLAMPYLKKGIMKDFVSHTKYVVKSMEMIIDGEGGDEDILIPSAILHDVGWSKVDPSLQLNDDMEKKREGQRQHITFAKEIVEEVLDQAGYSEEDIQKVVGIVMAHKFQDPEDKEKQMLIDADNLSDTFKEQFDSDVVAYHSTPEQVYEYRMNNKYYTQTAQQIADQQMAKLKAEIKDKI
ncbi:MAG: HD domain-containing protein [Patescibacteria group bacterium]|jgi:HD superfamily phosphodiesterase